MTARVSVCVCVANVVTVTVVLLPIFDTDAVARESDLIEKFGLSK